jgi:hypothetical protein
MHWRIAGSRGFNVVSQRLQGVSCDQRPGSRIGTPPPDAAILSFIERAPVPPADLSHAQARTTSAECHGAGIVPDAMVVVANVQSLGSETLIPSFLGFSLSEWSCRRHNSQHHRLNCIPRENRTHPLSESCLTRESGCLELPLGTDRFCPRGRSDQTSPLADRATSVGSTLKPARGFC